MYRILHSNRCEKICDTIKNKIKEARGRVRMERKKNLLIVTLSMRKRRKEYGCLFFLFLFFFWGGGEGSEDGMSIR